MGITFSSRIEEYEQQDYEWGSLSVHKFVQDPTLQKLLLSTEKENKDKIKNRIQKARAEFPGSNPVPVTLFACLN